MSFSYDAEAKRTRLDLRRFQIKLCEGAQARILSRPDRIALLLGLTAHLTVSQFGQSAVPGIAGLPFRRASPARLMAPPP